MQRYLLIFLPIIIGVITVLTNHASIENLLNKFIDWLSVRKQKITPGSGKLNKYFVRPFLWLGIKIRDWTDDIAHSGLKSGIRIALYLYLGGLFLYLFVAFSAIVICFFAIVLGFAIFGKLTPGGEPGSTVDYTRTEEENSGWGNKDVVTRDSSGNVISKSEERKDVFGGKRIETRNKDGELISTSEREEDWSGNKYLETRDSSGNVISKSEERKDVFGGKRIETRNKDGELISTSESRKDLLGNEYLETKHVKTGEE